MKYQIIKGLLLVLIVSSCQNKTQTKLLQEDSSASVYNLFESIERGKYLTGIMDCAACHSPKVFTPQGPMPDPDRLFMGFDSSQPTIVLDENEINVAQKWVFFSPEMTASVGPWGISYSANITSDDTGIGTWSFEQFKTALTKGKYKGLESSRDLLPPMPWPAYKDLKEEDLRAIYDYLQNTKAIENVVPAPSKIFQ